ncbi:homoserine O-succinyltransferase MetA [Rhodopseudomonas telluris]|uniref:Homoserine O-succinyltransferase n=1 Tax=Rhodopseudomonas telluris TaxID=644215 RepID=A0ABV6ELZ6_9BRAD
MTLLFDKADLQDDAPLVPTNAAESAAPARRRVIEIGLVNNMSDAALRATERQFMQLLRDGAEGQTVRLHCFALPSVTRSQAARQRIASLYTDIAEIDALQLDGLIVTGAEPRAATLQGEPYWDEMRALVDWAEAHTRSTIWSCLAAHAAVLHLDGVERQRLPQKCSGVYGCDLMDDDALLAGLPAQPRVPHSRLNDLPAEKLAAAGYTMLTQAQGAGVDIFTRQTRSRFVFFQGHPEYDICSLQREYLRDIGRYLTGERQDYPDVPVDYFDDETEQALQMLRAEAEARRDPALIAKLPSLTLRADVAEAVEGTASALFRNWLTMLAQ